jgi:hypothetical protein
MQPQDIKLMRYTLAIIWLATGALSLGIYPRSDSLEMLARVGLHSTTAQIALYAAALLDILLGILTLARPVPALWRAQAALIAAYTAIITIWLPQYWLHPFGPVLKNLPILMMLWLLHQYGRKST